MMVALVMAGGRSERMRTRGNARHKVLREVAGGCLIDWNVQALRSFGFEEVYVAVHAQEPELIAYVRRDGSLHVFVEPAPLGTIGAARCLPVPVTDVLVVNGDNLTDLNLRALASFHLAHGAAMTIATHEEAFPVPWGFVRTDGDRVVAYEEKPQISVRISSGTYVLSRRAMEAIEAERRLDVPELVATLLASGHTVRSFAHSAQWIDVNDEMALARADEIVRASGTRWPGAESRRVAGV